MSKIERVKGGLDFYVGSVEVARVLVRQLQASWGANVTETAKLVGRREGRDLYRITLLVRLPAYAAGDFVRMDGQLYKVLGVDRRTLHLLDLSDWRVLRREPRRARQLKVVGRAADEAGAVVVSQQGQRVQLLDPVTYRTVDVELPHEARLTGEARVFREEERLWVVPPDHARQ